MWKDLTLRERHRFIKIAVQCGVYDLDIIRSLYDKNENSYDTGGETNTPAPAPTKPNRQPIDVKPILDKIREDRLAKHTNPESPMEQIKAFTDKLQEERFNREFMEWLLPSYTRNYIDVRRTVPVAEARPTFIRTYKDGGTKPDNPPNTIPLDKYIISNPYMTYPQDNAVSAPIRDWSIFMPKEDIGQQKEISLADNSENDSIMSLNIQKDFLPLVENPANKGYDSINQRYYAYSAIEDKNKKNPTYDIGNGVKLTRPANPKAYELYNSQVDSMGKHYLTKSQYDSTFMERLGEDYTNSKKIYNDFIKNEFGIDDGWKKLSPKERAFLMDYQFNVKNGGLYAFPKLMKAIYNKDIEEIKKECLRYMTKNGQKYELGRNKEILERVEHLYDD